MKRSLPPRIPLAPGLTLVVALLASAPHARAAVLGDIVSLSAVGAPLNVEIAASGDLSRAGECLRLASGAGNDGLVWVNDARIAVAGRGAHARVVVTGRTPVYEPALKLGIEDVCDSRLRRDYTLLLAFPELSPPLADAAPAEPPRSASTARPARPAAAPRPAREPVRPAPEERSSHPGRASVPNAPRQRTAPPSAPPAPDRLTLGGDELRATDGLRLSTELASIGRVGQTTDAQRDQLRREQQVLLSIDRTIVAQLELNDRIQALEEIQARMLERARELDAAPHAAPPASNAPAREPAPLPTSTLRDWLVPALALAALSLLLAVALHRMRRRRFDDDAAAAASPVEPAYPLRTEPMAPPAPAEPAEEPLPDTEALRAEKTEARHAAAPWRADKARPAPPGISIDEQAEEHESAIELAEIMMGFGRVQGAAETLAEFINSNPRKAVTPWLKLLEVYRAGGYRPEFDALARQLNKTFNVKAVTWDTFDDARRSSQTIEQMAHVIASIERVWGSRDCQAYLEKLLRDNRDGTREGFPLSVIDEILMLAGVLEEQLGPYRPTELAEATSPQMS